MEVYISIDGVLRNTIQKFDYHYGESFIVSETENETDFEYGVTKPILNNNLLNSYKFQSRDEYEFFLFMEYPIEIFGHAGMSYSTTFTDLNKLLYDNKEHNITLVGLDELGKAKPATLFFLSKNGYLGDNIKFVKTENLDSAWKNCDLWITDSLNIIQSCPKNKKVVKFNTKYNEHFTNSLQINKLTEIETSWLKSSENIITSTLTRLLRNVKQMKLSLTKTEPKLLK
jgi:hypothetical protein